MSTVSDGNEQTQVVPVKTEVQEHVRAPRRAGPKKPMPVAPAALQGHAARAQAGHCLQGRSGTDAENLADSISWQKGSLSKMRAIVETSKSGRRSAYWCPGSQSETR